MTKTSGNGKHRRITQDEVLVEDLADLSLTGASGVVWALDSPQLNANLVVLSAGDDMASHVNNDVDVLIITQSGSGVVIINGDSTPVGPSSIVLIPRGAQRSIQTTEGLVYFSIHQRRKGLAVG